MATLYPRPPREEKSSAGRISPLWFIAGGAAVIIATLLLLAHPDDPRPTGVRGDGESPDSTAAPAPPAPIPVASNPRSGIGANRDTIAAAFMVKPYSFVFRDGRPVNDESNYLGFSRKLPRASVQILGRPDDIAEVSYNDVILADTVWKVAAESAAMQMARMVDADAIPWAREVFKKIRAGRSTFASKTIGGKEWTISYSRIGPEGHFTIRPALPKSRTP